MESGTGEGTGHEAGYGEGRRRKEDGETVDGLCGVRRLAPAFQSGGKPPHSKRWL